MKIKIGYKTIIALFFIFLALLAIGYNFENKGAAIVFIEKDSSAYYAGLSFNHKIQPTKYEIIKEVNGIQINNAQHFYEVTKTLIPDDTIIIKTNKETYHVKILTNNNTNQPKPLGIIVDDIPKTNLRFGMDIAGGTRILLKPQGNASDEDLEIAKNMIENRLNLYGLSDLKIRIVSDTNNNKYISIEIAGKTVSNILDLISQTGKFEAKLGNTTVFYGGNKDISFVARTPQQGAGIVSTECPVKVNNEEAYVCRFRFGVYLTEEAANRFWNEAKKLSVVNNEYLNESLELYIDDQLVETLFVGKELRERPTTQVAVSGSGQGRTKKESYENALEQMKKLQTILMTGSLPVKLEIIQIEEVSSKLGKDFLKNALLIALLAIIVVSSIIGFRYKDVRISMLIILTMLAEILITLGFASFVKWNLDLVSIAGILIAIGSGVDDQIVITDELKSGKNRKLSLKEKMMNAFFIVFGSYFTTLAAMVPLFFAGAGLLKGFAFTTIVGITIGVFITRPAFSEMLSNIVKKEEN